MAINTLRNLFDKAVHHTHKEEDTMSITTHTTTHTHLHYECTPPEGMVCVPYTKGGYTYMHLFTYRTVVTEKDPSTLRTALQELAQQYGTWDMDDYTYPMHTHTHKEHAPMHYKLTLTTRTTMVWLMLSTLSTLLLMGVRTMVDVPTWGGVYTLLTVGIGHSLLCTLAWGAAHVYVRRHGTVVLSTRNLGR